MQRYSRFKWFQYEDKRALQLDCSDPDYYLGITEGDKFGYYKHGTRHWVVPRADLDFKVHIKPKDAERLLKASKGWKGKIKGVTVNPGEGGKDKAKSAPTSKDVQVLDINSSNLKAARYFKKERLLEVTFHNDVVWAYEEVSPREAKALENAESQGSFFYYKIRNVKPQYKIRS